MALSIKQPLKIGLGLALGVALISQTGRAQDESGLDDLLHAPELPASHWYASTDPKHRNDDYVLLAPGETRRIPLDPGQLARLWSTASEPDGLALSLHPAANKSIALLSDSKAALGNFVSKTYTLFPARDIGAGAPFNGTLGAGAALLGTNHSKLASKWFYQASVRPVVTGRAKTRIPQAGIIKQFRDNLHLAPGEEKSVEEWQTPGLIDEISVEGEGAKLSGAALSGLRLRATCEGVAAVDASLLGLAGQLVGTGPLQNSVANFDGSRVVLNWPMPFASAKMWLKNVGVAPVKLNVSVTLREYAAPPSPYRFCAREAAETSVKSKPLDILNVTGQGAFVGLALAVAPKPGAVSRTFAFLEGNETIIADGKPMEGTGTEDYFSSAWYFPDLPFAHPYEGLTSKTKAPNSVSAYRLMIPDPVPFQKSLQFNFEHDNGNMRSDLDWHWVAFWYQKPPIAPVSSAVSPLPSAAGSNAGAGSGAASPSQGPSIWWAFVAGPILGVVMYFVKKRRRA